MLPEVRVLFERAQRRRHAIEDLLRSAPAPFWQRTAEGDAWSARAHVAHLASMDAPVARLAQCALTGERAAWLWDTEVPQSLEAARRQAMAALAESSAGELSEALNAARAAIVPALAALKPESLEMRVLVAGANDSWGTPVSWPLRTYLVHWAEHDAIHEAAIRAAFTTPPDLSAVALTRRLR